MEGLSFVDGPLDYAAFKLSPDKKGYELFISYQGKDERVDLGYLEQIISYIPSAKEYFDQSNGTFKLQPAESPNRARWFTKRTLDRFFHIVGASESLKRAVELEHEMSQLEQARRFHLALYSELNVLGASCDASKNELLRAMDVRLAALREELTSTLDQAADGPCSFQELADLLEFTQSFASTDLKNLLLKYFALSQHSQVLDALDRKHSTSLHIDQISGAGNGTSLMDFAAASLSASSSTDKELHSRNTISPAKIAQAERKMLTDSEESSDSSDESRTPAERSRPMIRSASPRRSASPMRRIQIGRSGSRRSTALTIKNLGFYPAREKIPNNDRESDSEDEEPTDRPKKPENSVRSFSVQDAINLFESKQRDLSSDIQKRRASAETSASFVNTRKSVLRRWSAGMDDGSPKCAPGNASQEAPEEIRMDFEERSAEKNAEVGVSASSERSSIPGKNYDVDSTIDRNGEESVKNGTIEVVKPNLDETYEHEITAAEWNQQKEAELNQILVKMMESKPTGSLKQSECVANQASLDLSSEQKGGFYENYKEKRDARLRGQHAGKKVEKDGKLKTVKEDLERRKVEMSSKSSANVKQNQLGPSQKLLRNSSPSGLPKREVSKPQTSKKAPSRASPVSATRSSMSSVPTPRPSITPTRISTTPSSSSNSTNRKKNQPSPSPTKTIPKKERSQAQQPPTKSKGAQIEGKANLRSKDEKKQNMIKKSNTSSHGAKTGVTATADVSGTTSSKPSFYSKVTKKSSVVPLETKPFLRKGMGIGPGVGSVVKTKGTQADDLSKVDVNTNQIQDVETVTVMVDTPQSPECSEMDEVKIDPSESEQCESFQKQLEVGNLESNIMDQMEQVNSKPDECTKTEIGFPEKAPTDGGQICVPEDVADLIWVEMDEQEKPTVSEITSIESTIPAVAELSVRSPRVRHSLSQMLQADSGESEIVSEWGNAENPPALVYQKDSPKGFKRLLKFGRKSRGGDSMATGWASSPVLSEGEDDNEEPKGASRRNIDALLRKSAPHIKGFGQQKTMLGQSHDVGNSSKKSMECNTTNDLLPKRSNFSNIALPSPKLRQEKISAAAASTKATRSFFSLSTFRSKGSEAKLR
ncbi:hypothetical protein EJ110_NYTH09172 [Nymphaea thermarum]|nr:hypothetical protein EJ110_NYTH09172 [Nymphaea thermarum]